MNQRARLLTFLHGIEPRAWVFLNLHCGDPDQAAVLFRTSVRAFARVAERAPLARWPMLFWTTLLAQPGLSAPIAETGGNGLAAIAAGPRAVFLLPMVAGLDEAHATEALGISPRALAHALLQARAAWPDIAAHDAMRGLLLARIRQPTMADRQTMQALRDEALAEPIARAQETSPWRRTVVMAVIVLLLALAWRGIAQWSSRSTLVTGHSEALPTESVPPPPPLDAAGIVTHPDYGLLAAPDDAILARDLALLAWFDASQPSPAALALPTPAASSTVASAADFDALPDAERALLASAQASWTRLDPATRAGLSAQAHDWLQRSLAEQAAVRARVLAWDRLSIAERARQRAPFEAWRQLSALDQQRLRDTARRWSLLPAADQAGLRQRFAALSADAQRLWWLGPTLGRSLAPLAASFAFVPESQRSDFLVVLRSLDERGREDLLQLAQRLEPGERDRLRLALQAQAPAQRSHWLRSKRIQ